MDTETETVIGRETQTQMERDGYRDSHRETQTQTQFERQLLKLKAMRQLET